MASDLMKVLGWTIGGAILVRVLTSSQVGSNIQNIFGGWSTIIGAITGSGTPAAPSQGTPAPQQGGSPAG